MAPDAIDDDPEDRDAGHGELAIGPLDQGEPAGVEPGGHHRAVGPSAHDQRVGHGEDRRRVDDDQVIGLAEPADQLGQPGRLEDPARVAARGAGREEVEAAGLDGDQGPSSSSASPPRTSPRPEADRDVEQPAERGPTHVGVDQEGRGPGVGASGGQVGREGRLPLAAGGAGDHHATPFAGDAPLAERHPEMVQALDEPGELLLRLRSLGSSPARSSGSGAIERPRCGPSTKAGRCRRPAPT